MRYKSTRGKVNGIPFKEAVLMGLADDGGLLLPESIPVFYAEDLDELQKLSYPDLAYTLLSRFIDDIPAEDLKALVDKSYATFTHDEVTPVVEKGGLFILELFHGPTLAFKDVALQFLGNLFEYLLEEQNRTMNILGATSGDTGSAAIYGVRGKEKIQIFILHPKGRVSPVQEAQMTSVLDDNVFNLAVEGNFDDCQGIVKEIFGDTAFKEKYGLGAINSINWARVLAQVVYYFYAWARVKDATGKNSVTFSVPTGNFGDIFAGYIAKQMGLPVDRLILATNENNILTRFVTEGDYSTDSVVPTVSPSMDIQLASNFERYLYFLYEQDWAWVAADMEKLKAEGKIHFEPEQLALVQRDFGSATVNREQTLETIKSFYDNTGYVLDPHTAVGVRAGMMLAGPMSPLVCLSTAHPAKFGDAVREAIGKDPDRPDSLQGIENREKRCDTVDGNAATVCGYLAERALK